MSGSRHPRLHLALSLGILLLPFAAASRRITRGIDWTDEGFALTAPLRIVQGDLPVRDEMMTVYFLFDVVMAPIYALVPDITVLELRALGLALRLACALSWFWLLRRHAPPELVALAWAPVSIPFLTYWEPAYDALGSQLALLGISLWLHAGERRARLPLAALGGVLVGVAAIAYLPLVLLLLPIGALAVAGHFAEPLRGRRAATWLLAAGLAAVVVAAGAWYAALGLGADFAYVRAALADSQYASLSKMLDKKLPQTLKVACYACVAGAALVALSLLTRAAARRARWLAALPAVGFALLPFLFLSPAGGHAVGALLAGWKWPAGTALLVFALGFGMNLAALLLPFALARRATLEDREWLLLWGLAGGLALALFALIGVSAGSGLRKGVFAIGPIFALGALALFRAWRSLRTAGLLGAFAERVTVAGLALLLGVTALHGNARAWQHNHRDAPLAIHTTAFRQRYLQGITGARSRVVQMETLLRFLSTRLEPGDYLLAYDELPLLYFLTRTRPAVNYAWSRRDRYDDRVRRESLAYMLEHDRVPRFAVRSRRLQWAAPLAKDTRGVRESSDPFDRFLSRHYRLLTTIRGPDHLEIYELASRRQDLAVFGDVGSVSCAGVRAALDGASPSPRN